MSDDNKAKVKKTTIAENIYRELLPQKEKLSRKEFRKLVVTEIGKQLGVTNAGTLGAYFAHAQVIVGGKPVTFYNVTAPRAKRGQGAAPRKTAKSRKDNPAADAAAANESNLNRLAATMGAAPRAAKKTAPKKATPAKKAAKKSAPKKKKVKVETNILGPTLSSLSGVPTM